MEHDHLKKLETKIASLREVVTDLASADGYDVLFKIIHQPGWTTPAELAFALAMIETMSGAAHVLVEAKNALIAASRSVAA